MPDMQSFTKHGGNAGFGDGQSELKLRLIDMAVTRRSKLWLLCRLPRSLARRIRRFFAPWPIVAEDYEQRMVCPCRN